MIKAFTLTAHKQNQQIEVSITSSSPDIQIDSNQSRGVHRGFGAAITESAAYVYSLMDEAIKHEFINACYSSAGLGYNLGRVTIGSCDFSLGSYDYGLNDDLSDFSLKHEEKYLWPMLNDIAKVKTISLMASSWSPPAQFKTNHDKCHGGKLLDHQYQTYARYLVKYVQEMRAKGYCLDMLTLQNEPLATQVWESCLYDADEERKLALAVHEELRQANINQLNIFGYDHNRDRLMERANALFSGSGATLFAGIAYHWYDGNHHAAIAEFVKKFPEKDVLFTEGCVELLRLSDEDKRKGRFQRALRYANNYIRDAFNGAQGFIDWNVLLDERGGPNHVGNFCEAPLMYDRHQKRLIYNPSYYAIRQLAHYIHPGAQLLASSTSISEIHHVAYRNRDQSLVVVILNLGPARAIVTAFDKQRYLCYIESESITTLEFGV